MTTRKPRSGGSVEEIEARQSFKSWVAGELEEWGQEPSPRERQGWACGYDAGLADAEERAERYRKALEEIMNWPCPYGREDYCAQCQHDLEIIRAALGRE
jgi:hypothetical protein